MGILGLIMNARMRISPAQEVCHLRDAKEKSEKVHIEASTTDWQLTSWQKKFIGSFAEEDHKKQ